MSVLQDAKINKLLFTREELDRLTRVITCGEPEKLTNVIDDMTPEKEIEIQRLVNYLTPIAEGFESKVRKEIEDLPGGITTPEEEALWEKKLQEEFNDFANGINKKRKKLAKEKVEDESDSLDKGQDFPNEETMVGVSGATVKVPDESEHESEPKNDGDEDDEDAVPQEPERTLEEVKAELSKKSKVLKKLEAKKIKSFADTDKISLLKAEIVDLQVEEKTLA